VKKTESYRKRIGEILPGVTIETIEVNTDGLMNDAAIVNSEFVFRFPKHEYAFKHIETEARLLGFLRDKITLAIPAPFYSGPDALAYRMIEGETLRRDILLKLPEADQQSVADQLAQFFAELHGIEVSKAGFEIPPADSLVKYEGWVDAYERIREKVFPMLMPHVREFTREHFENFLNDPHNFDFVPKMVDTDIPPYHILFGRGERKINGIIDFGCAGVGDPAADFGVIIYNYGEGFFRRIQCVYPAAEQYLERARFYAGAMEVRWILTGIELKNNWWFAAHTSGAKDFGYN
jgi:aminoglycoside 2''-phosphotransferase